MLISQTLIGWLSEARGSGLRECTWQELLALKKKAPVKLLIPQVCYIFLVDINVSTFLKKDTITQLMMQTLGIGELDSCRFSVVAVFGFPAFENAKPFPRVPCNGGFPMI